MKRKNERRTRETLALVERHEIDAFRVGRTAEDVLAALVDVDALLPSRHCAITRVLRKSK